MFHIIEVMSKPRLKILMLTREEYFLSFKTRSSTFKSCAVAIALFYECLYTKISDESLQKSKFLRLISVRTK